MGEREHGQRGRGTMLGIAALAAGLALGAGVQAQENAAVAAVAYARSLEDVVRAAVEEGQARRAVVIARLGADLDHRFADGLTMLEVAAGRCDVATVRALARAGAHLPGDGTGRTLASVAAAAGCEPGEVAAMRGRVP